MKIKKTILSIIIVLLFAFLITISIKAEETTVVTDNGIGGNNLTSDFTTDKLKFETGAATPQFGPPGKYQFTTYLINPQATAPEFVKIYLATLEKGESFANYEMRLANKSQDGKVSQYIWEKDFSEKEVGLYNFYFEAKMGNKIIHGPSYHSDDCKPGGCAECCGTWGGPKIYSQELAENHKIYLFDKDKEKAIVAFDVGKNWIISVAISPDEKYLAAADNQAGLYVFKIGSSDLLWNFRGSFNHSSGEIGMDRGQVAFSQNGYLAASLKGVVYLFKTENGQPFWQYPLDKTLNGLTISENGKYLAAGGRDNQITFWETSSSTPAWQYHVVSAGGIAGGSVIRSMDMTPSGNYFAAGTSCPDRSVYVFSPSKSQPIFRAKAGANFPVETVSIADDGKYVLIGGGGSAEDPYVATLYKIGDENPVWRFDYNKNPTISVALSPDGKNFALGYIISGILGGKTVSKQPSWQLENAGYVADMKYSANGQYLAAASGTNHVYLFSADGKNLLQNWQTENKTEAVAISASGKYVAAGTSLDRFVVFSGDEDNFSGAGVGELKEKQVVLVSPSSKKGQSPEKGISRYQRPFGFVIFTLGAILIILSLIVLRQVEKKWRFLVIILGLILLLVGAYLLLQNRLLGKTQNEEQAQNQIQID